MSRQREEKELVCVVCPYGCRLHVTLEGEEVLEVAGNICPQGGIYARQEATRPMRVITSLMRAKNRDKPFSVRTRDTVPKALFFQCVEQIRSTTPEAPIRCGDVVIENILGTGVDVISTQDVD